MKVPLRAAHVVLAMCVVTACSGSHGPRRTDPSPVSPEAGHRGNWGVIQESAFGPPAILPGLVGVESWTLPPGGGLGITSWGAFVAVVFGRDAQKPPTSILVRDLVRHRTLTIGPAQPGTVPELVVGVDDWLIERDERQLPRSACTRAPQGCFLWWIFARNLTTRTTKLLAHSTLPNDQGTIPTPVTGGHLVVWQQLAADNSVETVVYDVPSFVSRRLTKGVVFESFSIRAHDVVADDFSGRLHEIDVSTGIDRTRPGDFVGVLAADSGLAWLQKVGNAKAAVFEPRGGVRRIVAVRPDIFFLHFVGRDRLVVDDLRGAELFRVAGGRPSGPTLLAADVDPGLKDTSSPDGVVALGLSQGSREVVAIYRG